MRSARRATRPPQRRRFARLPALSVAIALLAAAGAAAQDNAECLSCHDDPQLTVVHGGATVSLNVDGALYERSVHGTLDCVMCHVDLMGTEEPHKPDVAPVSCAACHATEASPFPSTDALHGPGLVQKGLKFTASCAACHTTHAILPASDPDASTSRGRLAETCSQCHARLPEVHADVVDAALWNEPPGTLPSCADCHASHGSRMPAPGGMANGDCLQCHARADLKTDAGRPDPSLRVDADAYAHGMHADVGCAQCHNDVRASPTRPCETAGRDVNCAMCHAAVAQEYGQGIHGQLAAKGDPDAPRCIDCHAVHAAAPRGQPGSPLAPDQIPELCARCHREGEKAARRIEADVQDIVGSYTESIHGRGLHEAGLVVTATCVSCHTAHRQLPPSDPASSVNPDHVAETCGRCHAGIEAAYHQGVHWKGNTTTAAKLPVCNDCHSSHTIMRTGGTDFRANVTQQCGTCHTDQADTFLETFHGKATQLGSSVAAHCHDCHGTHAILAPSDSRSTLGAEHAVNTCRKCHAGATAGFTGYLAHATPHDREHYPWLFWTYVSMLSLLVGTMAVALLHSLLWLVRLLLTRGEWRVQRARAKAPQLGRMFLRFTAFQRTQHLLMMLAFFGLALTGMALKFSWARWAQAVAPMLGGPDSMHLLHRLGAITLLAVFAVHVVHVLYRKRTDRRSWRQMLTGPDSILFGPRDLKDLRSALRWFLGRGPRPRFERYTYWEKFDYFAVFWGVAVIGATGLLLWFPELATRVMPGWLLNVAAIVHGDEALMAVVFIFTIHFFNCHFRPDKFPLDTVMFTGRISLEELRHERPLEYERLDRTGELDRRLVEPLPLAAQQAARVFGYLALGLGVAIVAMIVWSLLNGHP